ncbi:MAG: Trk system potassium transporter TrkA [Clostridiales bacterium]|nr:Trk system potassium transporter TrkA [Candidatus Crickella merdequi]
MKIAILGAGKLGLRLTEALTVGDYDITLVDTNEDKLNQIAQQYDVLTYVGDARSVDMLKKLNIKSYDFLLSCTSSDDTNIFSAACAKALGCKSVIARITEPEHMNQMEFIRKTFNIDHVVNPDMLITGEIYRYLIDKYSITNGVYANKRIMMIEFEADKEPQLIGMSMKEYRKSRPDILIVGISRHGKLIIPHGDDVIQSGDGVFVLGEKSKMIELSKKILVKHHRVPEAHKVMIVGGGRTGYYLAKRLSEYGAYVKIIETDKKRCHYLSNHLKNVMVLNGNGADIALLEDENLSDMDAFVSCTGFDEENLLLALTAKNHGVEDVISKISHESYDDLISALDIDIVLNPMDLSASTILRMISGEKRVLSNAILNGQAELMEIYTDEKMGMLGTPLKNLDLPDFFIIAAINRGDETIIPDGNTVIKPGDHVIIVCLLSHIGFIEKILKPTSKFGFFK